MRKTAKKEWMRPERQRHIKAGFLQELYEHVRGEKCALLKVLEKVKTGAAAPGTPLF